MYCELVACVCSVLRVSSDGRGCVDSDYTQHNPSHTDESLCCAHFFTVWGSRPIREIVSIPNMYKDTGR